MKIVQLICHRGSKLDLNGILHLMSEIIEFKISEMEWYRLEGDRTQAWPRE